MVHLEIVGPGVTPVLQRLGRSGRSKRRLTLTRYACGTRPARWSRWTASGACTTEGQLCLGCRRPCSRRCRLGWPSSRLSKRSAARMRSSGWSESRSHTRSRCLGRRRRRFRRSREGHEISRGATALQRYAPEGPRLSASEWLASNAKARTALILTGAAEASRPQVTASDWLRSFPSVQRVVRFGPISDVGNRKKRSLNV